MSTSHPSTVRRGSPTAHSGFGLKKWNFINLLCDIAVLRFLSSIITACLFTGISALTVWAQPTDSAARAVSPVNVHERVVRVTIAAVGDLMCHDSQITAAQQSHDLYNFEPCFSAVAPHLSQADLTLGNLETVHAGSKSRFTGYPAFNTPDAYSQACQKAGFDILTTANNHSYDRGYIGIRRTLDILDSLGILYTGTSRSYSERSKPLITTVGGIRLAICAYTYGLNQRIIGKRYPTLVNHLDTTAILEDLRYLRSLPPDEQPEKIIACVHWGKEYQLTPDPYQKKLARWMVEQGVDVILGSHPHVVQTVEALTIKRRDIDSTKAVIVYSMGNFLSGQRTIPRETGVIVRLSFERSSTGTVNITDGTFTPTYVHKTPGKIPGSYQILPIPNALEELRANPALYQRSVAQRLEEAVQEITAQFYTPSGFFSLYPPLNTIVEKLPVQPELSKPDTGKRNR